MGPEVVHCHATLTLETFVTWAVTSVGVGGAEVGQSDKPEYERLHSNACIHIPLAGRITILETLLLAAEPLLA